MKADILHCKVCGKAKRDLLLTAEQSIKNGTVAVRWICLVCLDQLQYELSPDGLEVEQ